jgi:uncharacterized membrane protein
LFTGAMQTLKTFRGYFLRGLAALLPTVVTIWIFVQCYIFVQENISIHINRGVVRLAVAVIDWYPPITNEDKRTYAMKNEPELQAQPAVLEERIKDDDIIKGTRIQVAEKYWVTGPGQITGFILALFGVCILGAILASVVGRTMWHIFENFLIRAPFIRKVYPYIKQVTDLMLSERKLTFLRVVALQYPRQGTWSIGLVTGSGLKRISESLTKEFLTVFVPTSPTPFTGYVIMTAKDETIELDMTIEEALRFTISGGVVTPSMLPSESRADSAKQTESKQK